MENLWKALDLLEPEVHVVQESRVYETPPWGVLEQPRFLNMAVRAETDLEPEDLLAHLKQIEADMGRVKTVRYGPRVIDLDMLFYDERIIVLPNLIVPHARLHERAFVLMPLMDLAPELRHPGLKLSLREIAKEVDFEGIRVVSE
jgi:2-amino-4-hydroxy-6-hydroxymethyldihydropteridine diphosphokinase